MRRLSTINLALLIAVAGAGIFIYLKPAREEPPVHALSARLPATAGSMRIERDGSPAIVVNRQQPAWRITAPIAAEADAEQVGRLLAILTARATQRFDAIRLERFELDRPRFRLTIDAEDFAFGAVNSVSGEQYVLKGGMVYAIAARYGAALPGDAMRLARRQVLSGSEQPLSFEMGEFSLRLEDGKWLVGPARAAPSQNDIERWVEDWRRVPAARVAPLILRTALSEVKIGLKSGTTVALSIVQREPELVIARHDEGLQYHFPAETARRLLVPPTGLSAK
jgi:hypothetical protein